MIKTEVIKDTGYELFQKLLSEKRKLISDKLILDKKDNHKYPIENTPFNIPENWHWCYLSDISIIQEGPGIRKHQYQDEGIQFLTVTNILEDAIDLEKSKKYISKSEYKKTYSHFTINKGDIVTACSGGSWGKSAMFDLDDKLILNTSTLRLRFFNDLGDNRFLYYLTKTSYFKDSLSSYITGQQPNYGYSHYSKIPIPLPPLPEQQRIVSILDEAFAAIAKAKANAEQNLKNAKELFESYLQGVFEKKGDGWEEKKLGEVTNIQRGSSPRPKGDPRYFSTRETEFNWITISDISSFCEDNVLLRTREWLTEEGSKQSRFVDENEFIIAVSGSTTGKCCITGIKGFIYDGLAVVKVKKNILDPIFLLNYMMSLYSTINNSKAGAAFPNINTNYLNNLPISFPPLKEQQTIVRQLDALRAETQKLEAVYQKKMDDLEELKKSILQKAFAGELKTEKAVAV